MYPRIIPIILFLAFCLNGCSLFKPEYNDFYYTNEISYDEYGNKTSGILGIIEETDKLNNDIKHVYFLVTPNTIKRYKLLREKYYGKFDLKTYPGYIPEDENEGIEKYKEDGINYKMTPMIMNIYRTLVVLDKNQIKEIDG